jgi:hypothetical protein
MTGFTTLRSIRRPLLDGLDLRVYELLGFTRYRQFPTYPLALIRDRLRVEHPISTGSPAAVFFAAPCGQKKSRPVDAVRLKFFRSLSHPGLVLAARVAPELCAGFTAYLRTPPSAGVLRGTP